jgi:hypothetical protein
LYFTKTRSRVGIFAPVATPKRWNTGVRNAVPEMETDMARSPFTASESQAALRRRLALTFYDLGLSDIINAATVNATAKGFVIGALTNQQASRLTNMLEDIAVACTANVVYVTSVRTLTSKIDISHPLPFDFTPARVLKKNKPVRS